VAQVTSIVRDRGREIGIVAILAVSVALLSAPAAFGAGDPVASGTFNFKRSSSFKHQLKSNHVKLKPKKFGIKSGSSVDPITGAGTLKLGKITFKKGNKKVVYSNAKATLGANGGKGNIKGSSGKLFSLSGGTVARNGFGATVSGVKVKLLKGAAKKINKKLDLHSLHKGSAGSLEVAEQPQTVQVTGGTVFIDIPTKFLPAAIGGTDPNTVAAKQPFHCLDAADGIVAIAPGEFGSVVHPNPNVPTPSGVGARIKLPVTGGTVSPAGNDGVIQVAGGVRLMSGKGLLGPLQPPACAAETPGPTTSTSILETTNLAPNLGLLNVQANTVLGGTSPGCNVTSPPPNCAIFGGDKGIAIGQTIDPAGITVSADPNTKTVTVNGGLIRNNATATTVLNGLFPNQGPAAQEFADGDKFGFSSVTVNTR
jgi:hypothetical protein